MTRQFRIPPELKGGDLVIGNQILKPSDFDWKKVDLADPYAVTGQKVRTTAVGTAKVKGRIVRVVVGYDEDEKLPCVSITYWGNGETSLSHCTFDFEEVQS